MATISITLDNPDLISPLKKLILNINGVRDFRVTRSDVAAVPNQTTRAAIEEIRNGRGVRCKNVEDLFEKLNS